MREPRRIDEIIMMLEQFALGEIDLPKPRVIAALKLLNLCIDDAPPPPDGDGEEASAVAGDQAVLLFPPKFAA